MKNGRRWRRRQSPTSNTTDFPTPKPLLRTGEMRDSIEYVVAVGSDLDVAVYQELGTSRIPPRSFLASAAIASDDRIHRLAAASVVGVLAGGGRHAAEIREIFHLLREAGRIIKEQVEDLFEDPDEKDSR
jgi:hypothetical protein